MIKLRTDERYQVFSKRRSKLWKSNKNCSGTSVAVFLGNDTNHFWIQLTVAFGSFMAETVMPLSQAVEGYEIFDKMRAQKVIFDATK